MPEQAKMDARRGGDEETGRSSRNENKPLPRRKYGISRPAAYLIQSTR
jgi:hypothetical protein